MEKTMKAALLYTSGGLKLEEIPIPTVGPRDILLKVKYCAICGSDQHNYFGQPFKEGQLMGHEFVGTVIEIGSEVKDIPLGMRGTGFSIGTCGVCYYCKKGRSNLCPELFANYSGYGRPGAFAEYVHIADAKLGANFFEIPKNISDKAAALIEPMGVASHVVSRTKPEVGANIIIQGGGPIGNLVAQAMRSKEPGSVIVTDVFSERLKFALDCGADAVINAKSDVLKEYQAITGEARWSGGTCGAADIVVEASGNPKAIALSLDLARSGATICQVGIAEHEAALNVSLLARKGLTWFGFAGSNMPKAIKLMANGTVNVEKIITHTFPLDRINEAFYVQRDDPSAMKVLIDAED